ncbi:glycoside hydrolase family 2 protein [Cohnella silvisoli]|uniref:beta-mannosidase n=1 Tax=Cohnella silvisoli TaxID=2873699 RepID=A0ABV1KQY4_9BACL|nr:glycoside hydrolase family 2 TIM barrel-domain containing protein [Cohnella silvisoli]MCD9024577.1 hypothetical protein [Cohnella silvisoli]
MRIDLKTNWELTGSYPGFWEFGRSMEVNVELKGIVPWIPAEVPGSVHWDLHRADYLPDPYFGANAPSCEWVNERDWLYRTTFAADASWSGKRIRLIVEGVDYSAKVLLNGLTIGSHTGMFTPGVFDLSGTLLIGEQNTLVIALERSPEGVAQLGYTNRVDHLKSRFGYKWDFCPRLVHIGLWKKVSLQVAEWCVFDHVGIETHQADHGSGLLLVNAVVESERAGKIRLTANVTDPDGLNAGSECFEGEVVPGLQKIRLRIPVKDVRLWWPNGYGEQPLYRIALQLETVEPAGDFVLSDTYGVRTGFRTLSFHANPGAHPDALAYTVAVNGEHLYVKGWNWVPVDQLYGRNREESLKHLIALAKRANVNMLRVWGGGLIEQQLFYELCDEAGILVWQEMMQSSSGFNNEPSISPAFLHNLTQTMLNVIREKRHHPSLAIWCGGNELTEGGHLDGRMLPLTDRQPNLRLLRDLVSDLDDTRLFLPTSPSGPTFFLDGKDAGKGILYDVHGPWKYAGVTEHYRLYNSSDALLHSEYGGDGFASPESLSRFLPPERLKLEQSGSIDWLLHGYEYWNMDDQLRSLFGDSFDTLERMAEAAQWLQAEGIRYAVEANRRRAPHCSGSLLWQFNEPYPNVSCTSAVDYYGDPKLAYSWVAKANRNLHASLQYEGISYLLGEYFRASAYLTRDSVKVDSVLLEWKARNATGDQIGEGSFVLKEVRVPTILAGEIEFAVPAGGDAFFVMLKVVDPTTRQALADNEYAFAVRRDDVRPPLQSFLLIPQTALDWNLEEVGGGTRINVTNTGKTTALWVRVRAVELDARLGPPPNRPLEDGFLVFPSETVSRHIEGVLPQERSWLVTALNS